MTIEKLSPAHSDTKKAVNSLIDLTSPAYINVVRTQDTVNTISVVGTGDTSLWPPVSAQPITGGDYEGYVKIGYLNENNPLDIYIEDGVDTSSAALESCDIVIPSDGIYTSSGFATFIHPTNNSVVSLCFVVERDGLYYFGQRTPKADMPNSGDPANISGDGSVSVIGGDKLSLWCASDTSGAIELNTLSINLIRIGER